ncbi:MAG: ribosome-associated protein [Actinomycetota bacterium]|jgi:ribosome-associated protein|nr:ribosome-associated protein [Actinomycetota bacterium]
MAVKVTRSVTIPDSELEFRFVRSGGPGGQHANKTSTKVELVWNVADSDALGPRQRARLLDNLGHRIDSSGVLRLRSDKHRSQFRNKEEVIDRLRGLVEDGLRVRTARIATAPSRKAKANRVEQKRRRSEVKRSRQRPRMDD